MAQDAPRDAYPARNGHNCLRRPSTLRSRCKIQPAGKRAFHVWSSFQLTMTARREKKNPAKKPVRRVVIVDDHPLFRHGLTQLIEADGTLSVCGEAASAPEGLGEIRRCQPDLAIVDVGLKGTNGIELMKSIKAEFPHVAVLMVSMHDESLYAIRALRAGARGYVMKQEALDRVVIAIREVLAGKVYLSQEMSDRVIMKFLQGENSSEEGVADRLSDRELEVLAQIGRGRSTREIAGDLHLSVKTIESHRLRIKEKLNFKTSPEMVRFAVEWVAQQTVP